jgi:hypothetical protein
MALTTAEQTFVETIMGEVPADLGCYVYHVAEHNTPKESRDYFNSIEIENHVGITTVYRGYNDTRPRLYAIILTESADSTPVIPAEATGLVSGLGE